MFTKTLFSTLFLVSYLLSLASSFSNLPMGSNSSTSQLQKRQLPTVHCGSRVSLRDARFLKSRTRTCTLGFAVKRVKVKGGAIGKRKGGTSFAHGYLTLGGCVPG